MDTPTPLNNGNTLLTGIDAALSQDERLNQMFGEPMEAVIDLPYPKVRTPLYIPGKTGKWRLTHSMVPITRGYFNGLQRVEEMNWVLTRRGKTGDRVWMSLTHMERESHMPHIAAAHGTVVVGGLGMGMYVYNLLLKREVERVIVVEKDPAVIRLFNKITTVGSWEGMSHKLSIVHGDMYRLDRGSMPANVDHVYVDIWPELGTEKARADMVRIMRQFPKGTSASWWGMELDFVEWASAAKRTDENERRVPNTKIVSADLTDEVAETWATRASEAGINISTVTSQPGWAGLALRATRNVTLY